MGEGFTEFLTQYGWYIIIFAVFIALMIIPQRRRKKAAQKMMDSLQPGKTIKTIGGIYGKIMAVKDDLVTIEVLPDKTRMVMDLSGPVTYTIKYDEAGNTLLIDMPQTAWSVQDDDVIKSGKFISAYRVEQLPESGTRVILKMADNTSVGNSGLLKAHAGKKDRLYLDVLKK